MKTRLMQRWRPIGASGVARHRQLIALCLFAGLASGCVSSTASFPTFGVSNLVYSDPCSATIGGFHEIAPAIAPLDNDEWLLAYLDGNEFRVYGDRIDKQNPTPQSPSDRILLETRESKSVDAAGSGTGANVAAWLVWNDVSPIPNAPVNPREACIRALDGSASSAECSVFGSDEVSSAVQTRMGSQYAVAVWDAHVQPSVLWEMRLAWRGNPPAGPWLESQFPVPPSGGRFEPSLAVDVTDEAWLVVWSKAPNIGYAFRQAGSAIGFQDPAAWAFGEIQTAASTIGHPVAAGRNGRWVIAWESDGGIGVATATGSQLSASTTLQAGFNLPKPSGSVLWDPDVETDGALWAIAWTSRTEEQANTDGREIQYTFFRSSGATWERGPVNQITSSNKASLRRSPALGVDSAGNWVLAFAHGYDGQADCTKIELARTTVKSTCQQPIFTKECVNARVRLWGDFAKCVEDKLGDYYLGVPDARDKIILECRPMLVWPSTCQVMDRFDETDGGETITDWLTGLVWERKGLNPDEAAQRLRRWGSVGALPPWKENGEAFDYIEELNSNRYAESAGWRMPSVVELLSIVGDTPGQVAADNAVETIDPGSFAGKSYWSRTLASMHTASDGCPAVAWNIIYAGSGSPNPNGAIVIDGIADGGRSVRAVRGGL